MSQQQKNNLSDKEKYEIDKNYDPNSKKIPIILSVLFIVLALIGWATYDLYKRRRN